MSKPPKILAFAGSTRKDSFNKKLVQVAAEFASRAGAEVTVIDLKDYPLPLFDQDLESASGPPENARKLKALFIDHQGLLIASPEYNSSITPILKNTLDWVSRPAANEPRLAAFQGKVASLISASPGELGGLRCLVHLRSILGNVGVIVLPDQIAVPKANEAFDETGNLKDTKQQSSLERVVTSLVKTTSKLMP